MPRFPSLRFLLAVTVLAASATLGGCLMVESKEYQFLVRPDGTGQAKIVFENISSVQDGGDDQTTKDYTQLLTDYIKGNRFEQDNPSYYNVKKRLFEQDGELYGEVTFDFHSYEDVGLFRLEGKGPWMYHTGAINAMADEKFDRSNGVFGGEKMPVVFWNEGTTQFMIRTTLTEPEKGVTHSLLPMYKRIGVN